MSEIVRFGVSIESELLESFDRHIAERSYATRSEALRDLIRDALVQSRLDAPRPEAIVLGSLTLVYDHHAHDLTERMNDLQHDHHELVVSVLHVHVSHDDCMEVLVLRGAAAEVRALADALLSLKGVKHGKLLITLPSKAITTKDKASPSRHSPNNSAHTHGSKLGVRRSLSRNKSE